MGKIRLKGRATRLSRRRGLENERRWYHVAIACAKRETYIGTVSSAQNNDSLWTPATSPLRFLDETQVESTVQMMSALQR
jgi:superfamily I DNA/RNA helicase